MITNQIDRLPRSAPLRIAVVGSGISGNLVARLLSKNAAEENAAEEYVRHHVEIFSADEHFGGHAQTVDVSIEGKTYPADVGFMVFNGRTYPNFCRMLDLLDVEWRDSDMSFGIRCDQTGLEYCGSSLNNLFAQRWNLFRPRFYLMLRDVLRFNREAPKLLTRPGNESLTLSEYLKAEGYGEDFIERYLIPMASAIWSARPKKFGQFPARSLVAFFSNHGLLQVRNQPVWRTILGGSRNYVSRLLETIPSRFRHADPVTRVWRCEDSIRLETASGRSDTFDRIVFATHADDTLKIIQDADASEREILGAFPYQRNTGVLHCNSSVLPRKKLAWASWNYRVPHHDEDRPVSVTYDLSRLQGLDSPKPILLTLNDEGFVPESDVMQRFIFRHPVFDGTAIRAQSRHSELNGHRGSYYCGAYWGYGFHEDGVNSAIRVASHFGKSLESWKAASSRDKSSTLANDQPNTVSATVSAGATSTWTN